MLVLILHVLFAVLLWHVMQPRPSHLAAVQLHGERMLVMRLIDHPRAARATPPPTPITPPRRMPQPQRPTVSARPATHEKLHRDAMVMQDREATPAPAASAAIPADARLFAKDGSVRLPPTPPQVSTGASPKATAVKPADDRQIMQHDSNLMHYKATRFEKYFPPPNETAGGAVGRHIGDAIKEIAKSVCDPSKADFVSNALCGVPPPPPSPKDRDERLNLPPPPLTDDPDLAKSLPLATCIAEYKADKPLSYGCPVNTPDLAFKAEMRLCIDLFRAGKRLKTWCPRDTPKRAAAESSPAASSSAGSP